MLCELKTVIAVYIFVFGVSTEKAWVSGARLLCGELGLGPTGLEMIHPEWQILDDGNRQSSILGRFIHNRRVTQAVWRKLLQQALSLTKEEKSLTYFLQASGQRTYLRSERRFYLFINLQSAALHLLEKRLKHKNVLFSELLAHRLGLLVADSAASLCPSSFETKKTKRFGEPCRSAQAAQNELWRK